MNKSLFILVNGLVVSTLLLPQQAQASTDATFGEIPSAVAVSNSGIAGVGLANARQASVITTTNTVSTIDVGCSVSDLAVDPAGTWGWSVCNDNTYLGVTSLVTGETRIADHFVANAFEVRYLPSTRAVVVLGAGGDITTMSATSINDYEILRTIRIGESAAALAVSPNGRTAYVATDSGKLVTVDLRSGKSKKISLPSSRASTAYAVEIGVDPSGRFLVLGGTEVSKKSANLTSFVLSLDARTGKLLSRRNIQFESGNSTTFSLAVGRSGVYLGTGLKVVTDGIASGLNRLTLNSRGRLGVPVAIGAESVIVSELALSANGRVLAVATTNGELKRVPG